MTEQHPCIVSQNGQRDQSGTYTGEGTVTYTSGFTYKGTFQNGKATFPGVVSDPKGIPLNGFYIQEYLDNGVYEGKFKNGKRDGFGFVTFPSGGRAENIYVNDVIHGTCFFTSANGDQEQQKYQNGECVDFCSRRADVQSAAERRIPASQDRISHVLELQRKSCDLDTANSELYLLKEMYQMLQNQVGKLQETIGQLYKELELKQTYLDHVNKQLEKLIGEKELLQNQVDVLTQLNQPLNVNVQQIIQELQNKNQQLQNVIQQLEHANIQIYKCRQQLKYYELELARKQQVTHNACKRCGNAFMTEDDLIQHQKLCRSFMCPICDTAALQGTQQLIMHIQSHTDRDQEE